MKNNVLLALFLGIEISLDSEEKDECDLESIDVKNPMQKTVMLKPENLIDDYKPTHKLDRQHICGERCVCEFEKNPQIFEHDPLKRPLLAGWARKLTGICFYIAPCGRSFNTLEATYKYLYTTKSKLTIDCFSFSSKIECMKEVIGYNDTNNKYLLNDVSHFYTLTHKHTSFITMAVTLSLSECSPKTNLYPIFLGLKVEFSYPVENCLAHSR